MLATIVVLLRRRGNISLRKKKKGRIQRIENKKTQWDVGLETAII